MSAGSIRRSEDQFLDVFTDPVSTPCGHNFCKTCISKHWDDESLRMCPLCNEQFYMGPQLRVNTFIREMVDQFRRRTSSSSEQQAAKPGEVPCDICTGTRLKATKSCLVCLTHLETHLKASRLRRHQLVDPVENLEDRMCQKHNKPLELFCRTDQTCVCLVCSVLDHKTHEFVPLREECEGKKAELEKTEAEVQQMIQKRRLKIQEIQESLKISKDAADRQKAEGVQVFTDLKESVERSLKELLKEIEDKQKTTEKQAEDFIKDLEQEISELMKRSSEVKQLSCSQDHLHLLQSFSSLKVAPPTRNWTEVRVHPPSYEGTVVRAVEQLMETLKKKTKKLVEADLKVGQVFDEDFTSDSDSDIEDPDLFMPADVKKAYCIEVEKKLPDNPEKVSLRECASVSGRWTFSVWNESLDRTGSVWMARRPWSDSRITVLHQDTSQKLSNWSCATKSKQKDEKSVVPLLKK